jgi:hypothetical protein
MLRVGPSGPVAPGLTPEADGLGALDSGGPLTVTVTVRLGVTPLSRALQV